MQRKDEETRIEPRTSEGPSLWGGTSTPFRWFGEMDRWFDDARREFERAWTSWPGALSTSLARFEGPRAPAIDVRDDGAELVVTAELPGVSKEDLEIRATADGLEIKAEAQGAREERDDGYVYRERSYAGFYRNLSLPANVAPEKVVATLENGVLEIRLPKQEPTPAPKAVKVKVQ